MTYSLTASAFKKVVDFDKSSGTVDLSGIDVGQEFTVEFFADALAGTGFSEFQGEAVATYRDPMSFGGGVSVEVDGVTPLNNALRAPIPRDQSHAEAIQSDGRIVTAGSAYDGANDDFALVRCNADGSAEVNFGANGKVVQDIRGDQDYAYSLSVQSDGKILAAGYPVGANRDFAILRLMATGFFGCAVRWQW
jgi:uncharacterized delta-60 repeat protein